MLCVTEGGPLQTRPSCGTPGFEAGSLPGDLDGNGTVAFEDFLVFAQNFGKRRADEGFNAACDLDGDGEVGFPDFLIFAQNFGKSTAADKVAA